MADGGRGRSTCCTPRSVVSGARRSPRRVRAAARCALARHLRRPALLEAAEAIPLDPQRLDPFAASSRGSGAHPCGRTSAPLHIGLGGTANVDGGAGLLEVLDELPAPTRVACDVDVPLLDAARSSPRRRALRRMTCAARGATPPMGELAPFAELPGRRSRRPGRGPRVSRCGAATRRAARPGLIGFDPVGYDLVVTGRAPSTVRRPVGKLPARWSGAVWRRSALRRVRRPHRRAPPDLEVIPLSGDPARARNDLSGPRATSTRVEAGSVVPIARTEVEQWSQVPIHRVSSTP